MLRGTRLLFLGNVGAKALGLLRELLFAWAFGTSHVASAFRVALSAVMIPMQLLTGEALAGGFIPLYVKRGEADPEGQRVLLWSVVIALGALSLAGALIVYLAAPLWLALLAPGFDPGTARLATDLVRIMALAIPLVVGSAVLSYVEMSRSTYWLAAIRAGLQSAAFCGSVVVAYLTGRPVILAWGLAVAYGALLVLGGVTLWRTGLLALPAAWKVSEARAALAALVRRTRVLVLGPVLVQGAVWCERAVASLIAVGVPAATDYARAITDSVLFVVAVPIGTVALVEYSRLSETDARARVENVIPVLLLCLLPGSVLLVAHAPLITAALYARGSFDDASVQMTATIVRGIGLGLWAHVLGYVCSKALNALGRNSATVRITGLAVVAQVLLTITAYPRLGVLALGLGPAAYAIVLLFGSAAALGAAGAVIRTLAVLLPGLAVQITLSLTLHLRGPWDFWVDALVALLVWGAYLAYVPACRSSTLRILEAARRVRS